MDFAIFRLFIRVSLFVIALIACIIYLIKKRKLIYSIFFDKEAIKKEYTGKNDIIFLRLANTILVIVAILLILYLKDFVLDMPYIINKQYATFPTSPIRNVSSPNSPLLKFSSELLYSVLM